MEAAKNEKIKQYIANRTSVRMRLDNAQCDAGGIVITYFDVFIN